MDKSKIKTIGVIGPNADSHAALIGNYHGTSSEYITILEGIRSYVGDEIKVLYSEGCQLKENKTEHLAWDHDRISEAQIVAEHSDVVVLCIGLNETLEGEEGDEGNNYASGDKEDLRLPESQRVLMEALAKTETPVILCLMAGSAIDLSYPRKYFEGILQLWYPGARGGKTVAEILFGEISPSGKLPVTFYESVEELPEFTDYSMEGRTYRYMKTKAQYPFGYGLTYGKVKITEVSINPIENNVQIHVVVKNTGNVDTGEVVQVYIKDMSSAHAPLHPALCGFKRIYIKAQETQYIELTINKRAFTVVDEEGNRFKDGKRFCFYVGCSQPDEKSVELMGQIAVSVEAFIE